MTPSVTDILWLIVAGGAVWAGVILWRRKRPEREPFPAAWRAVLERNLRAWPDLRGADRAKLERAIRRFLKAKTFEGCGGLAVTDEMRLTIAAHACLLTLSLPAPHYPGLSAILLYPSAFHAPQREEVGPVVVEGSEERIGESWERGALVLAWDEVLVDITAAQRGGNVALHEFSHQLDSQWDLSEGAPPYGSAAQRERWQHTFAGAFQQLERDVDARRPTVLDPYGATNEAEFFAVATECFFENPAALKAAHPALYRELRGFYRQDPARRQG